MDGTALTRCMGVLHCEVKDEMMLEMHIPLI